MEDKRTLERVAKVLVEDMFKIAERETVIITVDSGSRLEIAKAIFDKVKQNGGLPMLIEIPVGRGDSEVGMPDWPVSALDAVLGDADVWIEMNSVVLLYSGIWEKAINHNKKLRYLIIGHSSLKSIARVFTGYDIELLGKLLTGVLELAKNAKTVRITSKNGTDVSYQTDPIHALDIDDGDYSKPIFGTAPGYVNIVPKVGTMNGKIVFDELQNTSIFENGEALAFIMKDGKINEIQGSGEAEKFKSYLASFDDTNMYKISHHMIGLNPNVRSMVGEIVEDERIWGGVDFGFGHTSPIDMPPLGQPAKSHFDGIVACTSVFFDDVKVIEDGEVCYPALQTFAEALLMQKTK